MEVGKDIQNMRLDIAILPETKKNGEGVEKLGRYNHIWSGVPKDQPRNSGISMLIV